MDKILAWLLETLGLRQPIHYIGGSDTLPPPLSREREAELLAQYLQQAGADAIGCDSIDAGVEKAMELAGKDGVVLCFGSLYSIGAIRDALNQRNMK